MTFRLEECQVSGGARKARNTVAVIFGKDQNVPQAPFAEAVAGSLFRWFQIGGPSPYRWAGWSQFPPDPWWVAVFAFVRTFPSLFLREAAPEAGWEAPFRQMDKAKSSPPQFYK